MTLNALAENRIELISNTIINVNNFKIIVTRGKSFEELISENLNKKVNHLNTFSKVEEANYFFELLYNFFEKSDTFKTKFRNEFLEDFYDLKNDGVYNLYLLTW